MTENEVKEIATYEHPGSYVVVPVPVRDRILERLKKAERERGEARRAMREIAGRLPRAEFSYLSVETLEALAAARAAKEEG